MPPRRMAGRWTRKRSVRVVDIKSEKVTNRDERRLAITAGVKGALVLAGKVSAVAGNTSGADRQVEGAIEVGEVARQEGIGGIGKGIGIGTVDTIGDVRDQGTAIAGGKGDMTSGADTGITRVNVGTVLHSSALLEVLTL